MLTVSTEASELARGAILDSPGVPDDTSGVRLFVADERISLRLEDRS